MLLFNNRVETLVTARDTSSLGEKNLLLIHTGVRDFTVVSGGAGQVP